nr:uncharacterized protein LOC122321993 [Drosophila bipectinata]
MNKFTELFMYDTDEDNIMSNKLPTTSKFNDDQENMPLNDSHRSLEPNSNSTRLEHTDLLPEILKNTIEIKNTLKESSASTTEYTINIRSNIKTTNSNTHIYSYTTIINIFYTSTINLNF